MDLSTVAFLAVLTVASIVVSQQPFEEPYGPRHPLAKWASRSIAPLLGVSAFLLTLGLTGNGTDKILFDRLGNGAFWAAFMIVSAGLATAVKSREETVAILGLLHTRRFYRPR